MKGEQVSETSKHATEPMEPTEPERKPNDFEHASTGMRMLADYFDHIREKHEGDMGKCPPSFDLAIVAQDLNAWADRIDRTDGSWRSRAFRRVEAFMDEFDKVVLIPAGIVAMLVGEPGGAGAMFGLAAWYRLMTILRREGEDAASAPEVHAIPLSALMGARGDATRDPLDPKKLPGQYL